MICIQASLYPCKPTFYPRNKRLNKDIDIFHGEIFY